MLLLIIQRLSRGELPDTVLGQQSPICTRSRLILLWNCAMRAVEDVFQDRPQELNAYFVSLARVRSMLQMVVRLSMSTTATAFCSGVHSNRTWKWIRGITFDQLDTAFYEAFQQVIGLVAPLAEGQELNHFYLRINTTSVSHEGANTAP